MAYDCSGTRLCTNPVCTPQGPTVPDPTSFRDCQTILDRLHLNDGTLPARVMQHLEDGVAGRIPDTPTADVIAFQPRPPRVHTTQLVGTNAISLQAAQHAAEALGYVVRTVTPDALHVGSVEHRVRCTRLHCRCAHEWGGFQKCTSQYEKHRIYVYAVKSQWLRR